MNNTYDRSRQNPHSLSGMDSSNLRKWSPDDRISSAHWKRLSESAELFGQSPDFFLLKGNRLFLSDVPLDKYTTILFNESRYASFQPRTNPEKRFVDLHLTEFLSRTIGKRTNEDFFSWFEQLFESNPEGCRQLIQAAYNSILEKNGMDSDAICAILEVLARFDYEEMSPIGLVTASSAIALDSETVKTKALDLIGHWGNREAYNLLNKISAPSGFLARMKYDSLIKTFHHKYAVSEKNI